MKNEEIHNQIENIEKSIKTLKEFLSKTKTYECFTDVWDEIIGSRLEIVSKNKSDYGQTLIKRECQTLFYIQDRVLLNAREDIWESFRTRCGLTNKHISKLIKVTLHESYGIFASNETVGSFKE